MSKFEAADGVLPSRSREENKASSSDARSNSYSEILRSSSIIGGAQFINMVIGLVRTKLIAILIGPEGIGLISIYQAVIGIATSISGLGIQTSGVRDIAKLHGEGNVLEIDSVVHTLRRVCWAAGIAGMLLVIAISSTLSWQCFGSYEHTTAFTGLAVIILLTNITGGQTAIIQGTRRMSELAQISILSAIGTTFIVVGLYSLTGIAGIVPALVSSAAFTLLISTIYASRIPIYGRKPSWSETVERSKSLIYLGSAMVASSVFAGLTTWGIQILVAKKFGLTGLGVYTAAFSLSGLFVQFVLSAMGSDFYPRLVAHSHSNQEMTRLVNEQTEIGLLLAIPGLLGTLVSAQLVVSVFYTAEFSSATYLLKWFVLGCMGRVLSWPLGFSVLAKGQGALFAVTETVFCTLHLFLAWLGMKYFGLIGVSISFALLYLLYTIYMLLVNYATIRFRWSSRVVVLVASTVIATILCLLVELFFAFEVAFLTGLGIAVVSGIACLQQLALRADWRNPFRKRAGAQSESS
ncbi:O-antigen translocase [Pirellulaceae bacterium SH501]